MKCAVPRPCWWAVALLVVVVGNVCPADPPAPLHRRIDAFLAAQAGGTLAERADDGEFLRRAYLDLAGRVPSLEETRAFLADSPADSATSDHATERRTALVDRLLASDDHVRRMAQVFHVMLMERLGDHAEWQQFLQQAFKQNRPWDAMVRDILDPAADDPARRGAALWYTKRLEHYGQNPVDVPGLVRDVGRHFLGIDVQCAQCHDHLFVDDYKQEFYHGLFAFVGQTTIRTDVKFPAVGQKPLDKKVEFMSVFVQQPRSVGPKLPGGAEVAIPTFAKGEEFVRPPDKKTKFPGEPKFDTLALLGEQLPQRDNRLFTHNIANRLWWLLMGRGLVDPLDMHHAGNRPSHPELLDCLAEELAAHDFDMRWLLREIALSEAYQRSSTAGSGNMHLALPETYRIALEKPLSSEQMLASLRQVLGDGRPLKIDQTDKRWTEWQSRFDKALANPAREPEVGHNPTVKAALFLMHDATVLGWLEPAAGNLTDRLVQYSDSGALVDELYLATLSRRPTGEERSEAREYLAERSGQRAAAVSNLVWSLLASNEFCAYH